MANSTRKAQVLITANASQATQTIKDLQRLALLLADDINQATQRMQAFMKAGDTANANKEKKFISDLTARMQSYTQAVDKDIEKTKTLGQVISDLTNTKLRELKAAMGQGKSMLAALTGTDADIQKARQIQADMKKIGDQIRLIEGEYTKMSEVVAQLGTVSDTTLNKAIKQQQNLVDNLEKTDAAYNNEIATLKKLKAEEERRKNPKMAVSSARNIAANTAAYSVNDMKKALDTLNAEMAKLPSGSTDVKRLRREIELLQNAIKHAGEQQVSVNQVMAKMKLGKASVEELKMAYKQLEQELAKIENGDSNGIRKKQEQMAQLRKEIERVTGSVKQQDSVWKTAIRNITAYVGVFGAFNMIKTKITEAFNMNLKYSDSLNDIRKVSGLADDQIKQLSRDMAKIDTRTTQETLAQLAFQGSKLGMGKYGVEGLNQFVQAANQVNVAIGEEMGAEALPALSKLVETMGLIPKMGIENAMLATGSAMFKLSTTSTATSNNIVEFSKRLTGVARTAGITTDQLLALGSASDAMYLMPEVASTAMGKFIVALQKNHNLIEKDLGIQKGVIKSYYEQGRAMDAIVLVLERMKQMGNMNALGGIFKDLGSDGQRLVTAMVTMSKNVDMLKSHLYESNEAFEDASAVTAEYKMQQESANAIMERASNIWSKAFMNPDAVDTVKSFAQAWYDVSYFMNQNVPIAKLLQGTLWLVLQSVKMSVAALPGLILGFGIGGLLGTFTKLYTGSLALARAVVTLRTAFLALNTAAKFTWVGAVIGAVTSLVAYFATAKQKVDEFAQSTKSLNEYFNESVSAADKATDKLKFFRGALEDVNISQKERERLIKRFNNEYGSYLNKLGIEVNSVDDLRKHYKELNSEIRKKAMYELKQQAMGERLDPLRKRTAETGRLVQEELETINMPGYDRKYVQDRFEGGASWQRVYRDIIEGVLGKGGTWGKGENAAFYTPAGGKKAGSANLYRLLKEYAKNYAAERDETNDINKTWDAELRGYNAWFDEGVGTLENEAPDKDAAKAAAAAQREQNREWRDQLKEAEEQAKAIVDQVKNYYERQKTEIIKMGTELQQDPEVQKTFLDANEQRKNDALANVRKAIVGTDNDWDEFALTMIQDLKEPLGEDGRNESTKLLNSIKSNNLVALRKMIANLSKSLNKPESATMDAIWKNASLNEQANAKIDNTAQQRRRKESLERNYTRVVDTQSTTGMFLSGFFDASQEDFNEAEEKMLGYLVKARENIVDLLATRGEKTSMLELLGVDKDDEAFKPLFDMSEDDAKLFFQKLIQYSDEYTEALKKEHDEQKKIVDQMYSAYSRANEKRQADIQAQNRIFGAQNNVGSFLGVMMPKDDPEIALYKAKQEAAEHYYQFVMDHSTTQQLQEEAQLKMQQAQYAMLEKLAAATRERMQKLYSLTAPMERFGDSMGEALATLSDQTKTAQERTEAFKKAVLDATKAMIRSWGDMVIAAIKAQMQQNVTNAQIVRGLGSTTMASPVASTDTPAAAAPASTEGSVPGLGVLSSGNPEIATMQAQHEAQKNEMVSFHDFMIAEEQRYQEAMQAIKNGQSPWGAMGGDTEASPEVQAEQEKQQKILDAKTVGMNMLATAAKKGMQKLFRVESIEKKKELKLFKDKEGDLVETKEEGADQMTGIATDAAKAMTQIGVQEGAKQLAAQKSQNQEEMTNEVSTETGKTAINMTSAIAKAFSQLGPVGGAVAAAGITALITGLLSWALGLIGGGSSSKASTNTKLVSGMLTYDEGNVSQYVGTDGNVYSARNAGNLPSGVSMITSPIATTVNGSPALVAERGPEIVIGRQTTAAIMQNAPYLLSMLAQYDRNRSAGTLRTFDDGNISDMNTSLPSLVSGDQSPDSPLNQTLAALTSVLANLQRDGVRAHINKYGKGGLVDEVQSGLAFMAKHN